MAGWRKDLGPTGKQCPTEPTKIVGERGRRGEHPISDEGGAAQSFSIRRRIAAQLRPEGQRGALALWRGVVANAEITSSTASSVEKSTLYPKKMPRAIVAKKPVATHPDMCVESLPRKPHVVTFDNALFALKLAPAAGGLGAVLDGWTDPIGAHDKKVIEVEQAMLQEKELVGERRRHRGYYPLGVGCAKIDQGDDQRKQPLVGTTPHSYLAPLTYNNNGIRQ